MKLAFDLTILQSTKIDRPWKLTQEEPILVALEYWREDRTYFQQLDWVCWGDPSTPLVHVESTLFQCT